MPRNECLRRHRIERNWRQQEVADELGTALITYQRWEQGKQQPSAYYRVKLCTLFGKTAQELGLLEESSFSEPAERKASDTGPAAATLLDDQSQQRLSTSKAESSWNVPFARNPFFTGRSQLLECLHEQLSHNKRAALQNSVALCGLGGIGKTQTAIEYAYRYRQEYCAVFWVRADSRDMLIADTIAIAQLLALPGHDAQEQMQMVTVVKRWLEQHEGWLLILDNADDLSLLPDFLPREGHGHLLLTTRVQATGKLARSLSVDKMEMSEGIRFVLRRAKLLSEDEPLETVSAATRTTARQLVEELDSLPLALDQAGAYIEEIGCSFSEYLNLYHRYQLALLKRKSSITTEYPHTVASTWTLSFEKVEQANPAAADLLRLCAFLHPDAIPEVILSAGTASLGPNLQQLTSEPLLLNEAIQLLRRYSLIKRDAEAKLLHMHRLVQVVLKESMDLQLQRQWAMRAVCAVSAAFPYSQYDTWELCERLLPHALLTIQYIERDHLLCEEAGKLFHDVANYVLDRGRYAKTESLFQRALSIRETVLGPEHLDVAKTCHNLANLYRDLNKYGEAEPLYQRALHIFEQVLHPEHPVMAIVLNNMAMFYMAQGKYTEAERFFLQALAIREKKFGLEHPDTAAILHNLGSLYYDQGKLEEAEQFLQHALHILEQHYGSEYLQVAYPLHGLAFLYAEQGKDVEAESLYQRALNIRERQIPEHPEMAVVLHDYAAFQQKQGKQQDARSLYQHALSIREQALGTHHLKTMETRTRLIALLHVMGQHEGASQLEVAQREQGIQGEEQKAPSEE